MIPDMHEEPFITMRGITKTFHENGVRANRNIDLDIRRGEVHALVGENGSGKSTLMHILSGMIRADRGVISVKGQPAAFRTPHQALRAGIGMVHQHVQLVRQFSVLENIILGHEPRDAWGRIDARRASGKIQNLMDTYKLQVNLCQPVYSLSVDGMQKTMLLSLLYAEAELIILDEPMSLFEEENGDMLYSVLNRLRGNGHTLLLITHKLQEALDYSDRISVLRSGKHVGTFDSSGLDRENLSQLMIHGANKPVSRTGRIQALESRRTTAGGLQLELNGISYRGKNLPVLNNVSFKVFSGERVAITGIRENGLETLEQILAGFLIPSSGSVHYKGRSITGASIRELRRLKIAYIPTERLVRGASLDSSVAENMMVLNYKDFHSWGRLKREEIEHFSGTLGKQYNIKASPKDTLSQLSGGNIQKVIISRELHSFPDLVIFSEPSWGLDFSGRSFVLEKIQEVSSSGAAVLVITSDIDEALDCSDRIIVLYRGSVSGIINSGSAEKIDIGRLMLGIQADE